MVGETAELMIAQRGVAAVRLRLGRTDPDGADGQDREHIIELTAPLSAFAAESACREAQP